MRAWGGMRLFPVAVGALAAVLLLAPGGAGAATVVNGDFETGDLQGWQVQRETEAGNWFAYKGTSEPIAKVRGQQLPQAPPQGRYAAISDQLLPESLILSQEISLAPGLSHRLSLLAYYDSAVPLAAPGTLSVAEGQLGAQANQQFRIDVLRAGVPIDSLDSADILATAFRVGSGDPQSMMPTWVTANLSPFAGQTVTLRIANVASEELLTAGVDAVAVDSTSPGKPPPPLPQLGSNHFEVLGDGGKGPVVKRVGRNGVATLAIKVPGPGLLTAKGKLIKRVTLKAAKAGKLRLRLKLIPSALETLEQKHRLRVKVAITFDPAGGPPRTRSLMILFMLEAQA